MTADELFGLDEGAFVETFAGVFEHSAWIARAAYRQGPFHTFADLAEAMCAVLDAAGPEAALALVRAHPDLAGKAARAGALTAESEAEQAASGLDRLTEAEHARFTAYNAAYQAKFAFPFVMAVRGHDKHAILAAFERRLPNTPDAELETAIAEIKQIARWRLAAIAEG